MSAEKFRSGQFRAFSDHLFRGAAYVKRKARWGIVGHSDEFVNGYLDYAWRHCTVRRDKV